MNKGNPTPSPQFIQMVSPFMLRNSVLPSRPSMVDSPRNEIPQTPNTKLKPEYSTNSNTPIKPLSKGALRVNGHGDGDDGDAGDANVSKVLFGDDIRTPPQSPVPMSPSSIKNSSPVRRLVLQSRIRPSKIFVYLSYANIAIFHLARRRDACVRHFCYENLLVALNPVAIRRAFDESSVIIMVGLIRYA